MKCFNWFYTFRNRLMLHLMDLSRIYTFYEFISWSRLSSFNFPRKTAGSKAVVICSFVCSCSYNMDPDQTAPFGSGSPEKQRHISARSKTKRVILGGSRGGGERAGEPPPPLKSHKNIGCLCNTGPDPLKITKLPSQHSMLGYHLPASEDGPFIAIFDWILYPPST